MFLCVCPKEKKCFSLLLSAHARAKHGARAEQKYFLFSKFGTEIPRNKTFCKSLPDKCFIHLIDVKGTTLFSLIVDLSPKPDFWSVYSIISVLSLVSVLRFIKGTFPTNYIPTIEDTYRQVSMSFNSIFWHLQCWIIDLLPQDERGMERKTTANSIWHIVGAKEVTSHEIIICILNYSHFMSFYSDLFYFFSRISVAKFLIPF